MRPEFKDFRLGVEDIPGRGYDGSVSAPHQLGKNKGRRGVELVCVIHNYQERCFAGLQLQKTLHLLQHLYWMQLAGIGKLAQPPGHGAVRGFARNLCPVQFENIKA
nr:hypothetical protein [Arthrobacter caoxuetaonis]